MSPDNPKKTSEKARRQLLEEIRRRAEEAELRRIEDELEVSRRAPLGSGRPAEPQTPPPPTPPPRHEPPPPPQPQPPDVNAPLPPGFPPSPAEPEPAPAPPAAPMPTDLSSGSMEQFVERVATLRDEFFNALEVDDLDAAQRYLDGLAGLTPEDAGLDGMRARLAAMRESRTSLEDSAPGLGSPAEMFPAETPSRGETTVRTLLEKAEMLYQREQYGDALAALGTVLANDPGNEDALRLHELVERSRDLSEKVARESAQFQEAAAASKPGPEPEPEPPPKRAEPEVVPPAPVIPDILAGPVEQQGPMAPPKPPLAFRLRPLLKTAALLALVCAVAIGGYLIFRKLKATVSPSQAAVLILPSTIASGDPQAEEIADGFRVDLLQRLRAIADFRVVVPSSAARAAAASPVQTARTAGTGMLLRWAAGNTGGTLAIDEVLLDTAGSTVRWNKRYAVGLNDLAARRPELLQDLVGTIGVRTSDAEDAALRAVPTTIAGAYLACLRGRALLLQPGAAQAVQAVQQFESALQADPSFAEAQAALGWAHLVAWESGDPSADHLGAALRNAERALAAAPKNAEASRTRGAVEQAQGRYDLAIDDFNQALAVAPSDPEARRRLALALIMHGQPDKALAAAQQAVRNDPSNPASYTTMGLVQQFMAVLGGDSRDDHAAALRTFKVGERLSPDPGGYASRYLANVHLYAQQPDEAVSILTNDIAQDPENFESLYRLGRVQQAAGRPGTEWQQALAGARTAIGKRLAAAPGDPLLLSWLALVQTRLGAFKEAQAALTQALNSPNPGPAVLYNAARVRALQQDLKGSAELLQKAVQQNYDLTAVLDMDLFNLHGNPDFQRSVTR